MSFFARKGPFSLSELAELAGGSLERGEAGRAIQDVASLAEAGPDDATFFANVAYRQALKGSNAGVILTRAALAENVAPHIPLIVCKDPVQGFEALVRAFYPDAGRPLGVHETVGVSAQAHVHAAATLEDGVVVEAGASIGARAEIGAGTRIMPGAVIGADVRIGRDCSIGANASVIHAHIGDRVILHAGVRIGQDGFGYSPGPRGLMKVFHVGKVVIQNDVEIGANTCVDRGGVRDTIVGEGSKIDNLVQVAHNVVIGRHCVIAGSCALAGSVTFGDGVMLGGGAMVNNHVSVASGARIAALSAVQNDIDAPGDWGGVPARPAREWMREHYMILRMARERIEAGKARAGKGEGERNDND
ncbi:MAG: UDP-3-O-(3-hydroxymyristoyl)glucosamine N-acyltransferase [Rhodobiaceae bacterium]|nr:UDP-3-O-(3-hydroxymyristoyl)glucosamine N-acyltransferase [Rhodobiaceae bacterium]MCC0052725.1 UDP-3-O-(3-hydroxymyristoyl)glucosamine N-acyltransferase [Rhodobiaceae bacterium]